TLKKYAYKVLKKFSMDKCKPVLTPIAANMKPLKNNGVELINVNFYRSLIGSLLYLIATRLDIMYVTSFLSRFMHQPSKIHLGATRRVLRYIRGTSDFGLNFISQSNVTLEGYTDND